MNFHPETPGPAMSLPLPAGVDGRAGSTCPSHSPKWVIAQNPLNTNTFYIYTCLGCAESGAADEDTAAQSWAIIHTIETGHKQFARDIRSFWNVDKTDQSARSSI